MKIHSIASVSCVVKDSDVSARLYRDVLAVSFEGGEGDYLFTERLPGVKHFGLWPLAEAAKACFGSSEWPDGLSRPQASVEFEVASVADVGSAADELRQAGCSLLHDAKEEPWGQTITRLITDDGIIVGICYTPWFHDGQGGDRT